MVQGTIRKNHHRDHSGRGPVPHLQRIRTCDIGLSSPWNRITLRASVHDDLGNHASKKIFVKSHREAKARPIMSILHDLQAVSVEFNVAIEVHLKESPHWDLISPIVFGLIGLFLESKIVLNWATRQSGFLVLAWGQTGGKVPEHSENRNARKEGKEDCRLQTTPNLPGKV